MSGELRRAIDEAMLSGGIVPLGRDVLCDLCDAGWVRGLRGPDAVVRVTGGLS